MSNTVNRQFLIAARPVGMVKESDFKFNEAAIPEPGEGEIVVHVQMIAVEPSLRGHMENRTNYAKPVHIGDVMRARGAGVVVKSKHPDYKPGDRVHGLVGFQDYAVLGGDNPPEGRIPEGTSYEAALYVFNTSGFTAYYGIMEIGQPKPGNCALISGAAGAVGSIAGQVAKIAGCHVVGIAGSDEKCRWLVDELGFDAAINYKTEDVSARVKELCPNGIDIYFDNVAGEILDIALENLAMNARVVLCGGITRYNESGPVPGPYNYFNLIMMRAKMEGFIVVDHRDRFDEWSEIMGQWVAGGKLKYRTDMLDGFENLPRGLIRLFTGENIGKQLIKIADA